MSNTFPLNDPPDWHASAQELISGLVALSSSDERIRLLQRICDGLGDQLYPAFLQILPDLGPITLG